MLTCSLKLLHNLLTLMKNLTAWLLLLHILVILQLTSENLVEIFGGAKYIIIIISTLLLLTIPSSQLLLSIRCLKLLHTVLVFILKILQQISWIHKLIKLLLPLIIASILLSGHRCIRLIIILLQKYWSSDQAVWLWLF